MIADLRVFTVSVDRHRLSHPSLRAFCALLYSSRDALADFAGTVQWRRFAEPLWRFHNRAVVSPLPLCSSALLPPSDADTIEREGRSLELRRPDAAMFVRRIRDQLAACRGSTDRPLGVQISDILQKRTIDLVLLGANDDEFVTVISRELAQDGTPAEVLSRPRQHRERERLRRGCTALVIGKLSHTERAVLRAPLGDITVAVVQYDWVNDQEARDLAGPSLSQLRTGGDSLPTHVVVTEKVAQTGHGEHREPHLVERLPFEHVDPWQVFAIKEGSPSEREDLVTATMLILAGAQRELLATLLNEDGSADVVRFCEGKSPHAVEVRVPAIGPGDLYIRHADPLDQDTIIAIGQDLLAEQGQGERVATLQRQWKDSLGARIRRDGLTNVTDEVAKRCPGWNPVEDNVERWARNETLGPQQKQTFRALCQFLGISDEKAAEHWTAKNIIHQARIAAGRKLNAAMVQRAVSMCHDDNLVFNAAKTLQIAGRATTVYPVEFVAPKTREVPRSWLQRDPVPVQPFDLDELLNG